MAKTDGFALCALLGGMLALASCSPDGESADPGGTAALHLRQGDAAQESSGPAGQTTTKADETHDPIGRCRLVVRDAILINGDCRIRKAPDGGFQIASLDGLYIGQVLISPDGAVGYWNETPGATRAHGALGSVERQGACWTNATAELCAWAD